MQFVRTTESEAAAAAAAKLTIDIAAEALADGAAFDFFCGDEVYGNCTQLREFFEAHGQGYVLRVPRGEAVVSHDQAYQRSRLEPFPAERISGFLRAASGGPPRTLTSSRWPG